MSAKPRSLVHGFTIGLCLTSVSAGTETRASARPNILWITCEDISPHLGCYGDVDAVTPTLDRLAERGIRYTNAFSHASVCAPSRSGLITGMYPSSLGSHHMRCVATLPNDIKCLPEYLRDAGYYCTNASKTDYNFAVPENAWDQVREGHWRGRRPGQPFFSVFNLTVTHESRIRATDERFAACTKRLRPDQRHDPTKVVLPPYHPDTPLVRRDWARCHDLITAMDYQVADLLGQLEEDGLTDETIVFFFSDHGSGLPRMKQWVWDGGMRVPLIIAFPEKCQHLAPGKHDTATDRLVSFVDFAPTVLSLAGLKIPEPMHGKAFLGPQAERPRRYVYGIRDRMDERYDMTRVVRDKHYKYFRNYMPHLPYWPWMDYAEKLPTAQELRRLAAAGQLIGAAAGFVQDRKPVEELFDIQADPHETRNLVASPEHREALERMRAAHLEWSRRTKDLGLLPEQDLRDRAAGSSEYEMSRVPGKYPHQRILDAALLVGRGAGALPAMIERLTDADCAVRYWAVVALHNLGAKAMPAADALTRALGDPSPEVQIAAAHALCNLNRESAARPVLVQALQHESMWVRLAAANVLDYIGEKARPAIEPMKRAVQDQSHANRYIRWTLDHVIERFAPGSDSTSRPAPGSSSKRDLPAGPEACADPAKRRVTHDGAVRTTRVSRTPGGTAPRPL